MHALSACITVNKVLFFRLSPNNYYYCCFSPLQIPFIIKVFVKMMTVEKRMACSFQSTAAGKERNEKHCACFFRLKSVGPVGRRQGASIYDVHKILGIFHPLPLLCPQNLY